MDADPSNAIGTFSGKSSDTFSLNTQVSLITHGLFLAGSRSISSKCGNGTEPEQSVPINKLHAEEKSEAKDKIKLESEISGSHPKGSSAENLAGFRRNKSGKVFSTQFNNESGGQK